MTPGSPPAEAVGAATAGTPSGTAVGPGEVQALLVDIFALTGQKVQHDDPLVAAALIHSALLRRAGQDAARAIEQAAHGARLPQPLDHDITRTIRYLGLWHSQVMFGMVMFGMVLFGMVLFVICFLASALGTLLAASACR